MTIDLILVRHGRAKGKENWSKQGLKDSDRPLTTKGREDFRLQALGLSLLVGRLERIVTSPYTRCLQTAKILSDELAQSQAPLSLKVLTPGTLSEKVVEELGKFDRGAIILVGHEPDLSGLIDFLLSSNYKRSWRELKKGSAVKLSFPARIKAGEGRLNWYLKPKALRALGHSFAQSFQRGKKAAASPKLQAVG